ncbi:MAG TPA: glycosyltransferase family 39 protein [Acidobacteriaceae bacterium]|nr:glycosyltransferase family 39 protein [Acidobacteriaceae bacterium]
MQPLMQDATVGVDHQKRSHAAAEDRESLPAVSAPFLSPSSEKSSIYQTYLNTLLVTVCAAIYLLPFMRILLSGTDEGTLVYGAVRIIHGQVFARDFFEVMGPGTFYWLALFFKLFGVSFFAARVCLFVTSLGTLMLMYFLSRRICSRYQVLPAVILVAVYFSTIWPIVNHHVDSNFFALLSIACIARWQDVSRNLLLAAAGAFAAGTTLVLQPKGLLVLFAMVLWLWMEQRRRGASFSHLAILIAGYGSTIGVVLLYFWNRGALRDLLYVNLIWPYQNYGAVNAIPYARGLLQYWSHWIAAFHGVRWLIPLAAILFTPFLLIATLPAAALLLGLPHGKDNLRPTILLYWLCGGALWLSEIHRRDISHLTAGSPVLIILCVYFLGQYRMRIADVALQLLAVSATTLAVANLFFTLSARTISTRVGTVATFKPDPVVGFLDSNVPAGTEIFTYPYCPMYYFLSATANPSRYSLLMYNYNTTSQFQDAIQTLEQRKVRYVVWDTAFQKDAVDLFTAKGFEPPEGLLMEPYLESHYRVLKRLGGMAIMERKTDQPASQR